MTSTARCTGPLLGLAMLQFTIPREVGCGSTEAFPPIIHIQPAKVQVAALAFKHTAGSTFLFYRLMTFFSMTFGFTR